MTEVQEITNLLTRTKVIAIVGLSPKPDRPSHEVAQFLLARGYDIIPVNPACVEILGRPCYPDLAAVPRAVDMVDVFRKSEDVLPIAQDAIRIGAKSLWLQLGVINPQATVLAEAAGLIAVENLCIKIEYMQRFGFQPLD
ncbi:MAG: CoA-binding protein [Rhodocyclales bacterium]|nr:CoA-binding protein [Rhodocyclales bacterium]MBH1976117.1 CoA-binding protein [Rhodocyclales bacterium]